jgi:formylmethanofuran dehydrogenase subunit E
MSNKETLTRLLTEAVRNHGHLCPGLVLGVRMAICGLNAVGIFDPKGTDRNRLYLIVEIDRCIAGALQIVTGCSLGHRTIKIMDYGKMAATFVNLETHEAVRLYAREEGRRKADQYLPHVQAKYLRHIEAYKTIPDDELFEGRAVSVNIPSWDLPGAKPLLKARCDLCGEWVHDGKDIYKAQSTLCRPCLEGGYYFDLGALSNSPCPGVEECRLAS